MSLPRIEPYELPGAQDIPSQRAPWRPSRDRAALLVHDMQRYFVRAFPSDASPIAPAIENMDRLRRRCADVGVPVFYTAQVGGQDQRDRGLQRDFWGPGMTGDPADHEIVDRLRPLPGTVVLEKWRYSAFQRSNLEALLRARGRDQLIVTGVYGHIGCLLTAADAFMRDVEPFLVIDAVADFSREWHDMTVAYAAERFAVPITTSQLLAVL